MELRDPHRCTRCHAVEEGPPPARHRAVDEMGEEGRWCAGELVAVAYLPFDLAYRAPTGTVIALVADDPEVAPEAVAARLPVHVAGSMLGVQLLPPVRVELVAWLSACPGARLLPT
jgi:hypothetical protein